MGTTFSGFIRVRDTKEMAQIVAELVRQGVTFEVSRVNHETWLIELTGGY